MGTPLADAALPGNGCSSPSDAALQVMVVSAHRTRQSWGMDTPLGGRSLAERLLSDPRPSGYKASDQCRWADTTHAHAAASRTNAAGGASKFLKLLYLVVSSRSESC